MNERIRKLAERAGFSYMPSDYSDMADSYKCHDFEIEKFAELIVRECVEQIIIRERADGEWYQYDIFKHFGVEE